MANSNNVTLRVTIGRPLIYEEVDANFQELINIIDDYNQFYINEYLEFFSGQTSLNDEYRTELDDHENRISTNETDIESVTQAFEAHEVASDPHPQYTTDAEATTIAEENAVLFAIALG